MFDYLYGGAGSRKTSRLCEKALEFLKSAVGRPSRLALTTYARDAANQLLDRLRVLVLRDQDLTWPQKLDLVNGLDAATIGTNHALGRSAMDQHWLELGKTPSPEVIDEAARREIITVAINAVGLSAAQQQRLDSLSQRLTRPQPHRDIRALVDMISHLGISASTLPSACMASINVLCNELDRLRTVHGVTATEATFLKHASQAAAQLQAHPKGNTGATLTAREAIAAYIKEPSWARLDKLREIEALSKATKKEPITPDAAIVAPLRNAAIQYHLFPEFVADLRDYVDIISTVAAGAHHEYRRLVGEANRVDFAEMEQALNDLLSDPARRKAFCAPFGFIGSDESQDMTARSAAAIAAVTQEVGDGAWLADPNQSIYPFRGADHVAVDNEARNLLNAIAAGKSPTTHHENHRSPPGIIRFVNDLFFWLRSTVLAGGPAAANLRHLPEDHIQTAGARPAGAVAGPGKVERWQLSETSQPKRFAQLADGVAGILARPADADGKRVAPEDICIMVRDRYVKKDAAKALRDRGIKVAMRSSGLFDGREVRVILNAARLLLDKADAIAEATLWFLLEGRPQPAGHAPSLDTWLIDRIAKNPATPKPVWLDAIDNARSTNVDTLLSPLAAVVLAIETTGILGRITSWGDSFERQARIDSLLVLAASFGKQAKAAGRPATVGGFLAMCEERAAKEAQTFSAHRSGSRNDADDGFDAEVPPKDHPGVRLMTNHATKGLGFPITILADFSLPTHAFDAFEITTLNGTPHVWPDPIHGEENPALVAIARGLADGRARFEKQVDAETELMYVSFSRSQGELIVAPADQPKASNWLPAVFGPSNPAAGSPTGIDHFLPMNPAAKQVVHTQPAAPLPGGAAPLPAADYTFVNTLAATLPAAGGAAPPAAPANAILSAPPRPLTSVAHQPRYRSPSDNRTSTGSWRVGSASVAVPGQTDLITGGFKAAAAAKADALGEAFHAFMAAIPSLRPLAEGDAATQKQTRRLWEKVAARCLGGFLEPADVANIAKAGLTPAAMVDRGQAFVDWCLKEFGITPAEWTVEAGVSGPASAAIGGTWRGRVDLVFVARAGSLAGRRVLVDHKAVMAAQPACLAKADEYVGEVTAYAEALAGPAALAAAGAASLAPDAIFIHFPLAAAIVPIVNGPPTGARRSMTSYDLIGDVHGYADQLHGLLGRLGYRQRGGVYRHPARTAVFLGDFVDRGPKIAEGLHIARSMVDAGAAVAVMGNHELNALAFDTADPRAPGEYLRRHTEKNIRQHAATVNQLSPGDLASYLAWFLTLPLWLDLDGLRVVHACWDDTSLAAVGRADAPTTSGFVPAACSDAGPLFTAVETLLKGKEAAMPAGTYQLDSDGQPRSHFRLRWYAGADGQTYRTYGLMNEPISCNEQLAPDIVAGASPYPASAPPVFVGHYGLRGQSPTLLAPNVACVDWGVASGGYLCAYRWDGEQELDPQKFVTTE